MKPYRDIFEVIASRTMTMLIESDGGKPLALRKEDSADLLQWMADISNGGTLATGFDDLLTSFISEAPI